MLQPKRLMNVIDAIAARRSVRNYRSEMVDYGSIDKLLEAAVRAPTAMHAEPFSFVIVQDRAWLSRISDLSKALARQEWPNEDMHYGGTSAETLNDPDVDVFHHAGTLIVICADTTGSFAVADCWLAAENLMLAASAMELGTCLVGLAVPVLNSPEIKAELEIPPEFMAVAPIVVGVPVAGTSPTTRKEPRILCWKSSLAHGEPG